VGWDEKRKKNKKIKVQLCSSIPYHDKLRNEIDVVIPRRSKRCRGLFSRTETLKQLHTYKKQKRLKSG